MGEVYKAQDTSLERAVALKILPPDLVRNDERVRRFMQEAKSASSLNHPHIITIHEIGETSVSSGDGAPAQTIHYIAMELVDGATLRQRIHDDGTNLRTLIEYLAQAADGLAKAHAAGIIHRDLKPDNIMVTRDGFAKVLDFGLAKLIARKSVSEGSVERTEVREDTRDGAILGTVAYMSPEQVQGRVVDQRSDIFSFGSILYEAATRRRPFEAESDVDIMHRIVHDKPVAIDEIAPTVPAELRRLIRRCLAKDPDKRFQSMKDLSLELSEIAAEFEQLSASASSHTSGSISQPAIAPAASRRPVWIVAVIVLLAAAIFAVYEWRKPGRQSRELVSYGSMKIQRVTSVGDVFAAAVSPDGKYIVHADRDDDGQFSLRVLQVNTGTDVRIVGPLPTHFEGVAFAPDSDYLYYATRETRESVYSWLYHIPALGGTPRKVAFDVDSGPSFSPDGKSMVFARGVPASGTDVIIMPAAGGPQRALTRLRRLRSIIAPAWSPDGKTIGVASEDLAGGLHVSLMAVDVASGKQNVIGTTEWLTVNNMVWMPDGSGLLVAATHPQASRVQLWLQPFPSGDPVRVTNDLNSYTSVTVTAGAKTLAAAVQQSGRAELTVADKPFTNTGNQSVTSVAVSRRGPVAYAFESDEEYAIAIVDAPGQSPRLLRNGGKSYWPSMTADGKTVVFSTERENDVSHLFLADTDGAHIRQVTSGKGELMGTISPDGAMIAYITPDFSLLVVPVAGGTPRRIAGKLRTPFVHFSPDSKRIAFTTWVPDGDRFTPHLRAHDVSSGAAVIDLIAAGIYPRWLPDGKAIALIDSVGRNIVKHPLDGTPAVPLTQFKRGEINGFDFMPDGRLILARGDFSYDVVTITDFRRTGP